MRFIGSKVLLLKKIEEAIKDNIQDAVSFCDIFAGTASVARYFKKNYKIISNDHLHFSYVLQRATLANNKCPAFKKIVEKLKQNPFDYFLKVDIQIKHLKQTPFVYNNYSPTEKSLRQYFTNENALKIDFIRQTIEEWKNENLLNDNEYYYLLAGLIEAIPFISNIAGTYGAFLKHWDKRAFKKLEMVKLEVEDNGKDNQCFNEDSNELIKYISGDILYVDPPYNHRQYASNYHVLETISRYDNPEITGKTGLRPYKDIYSNYCIKNKVLFAFTELIENAHFKNIIVSYSSEGIMTEEEIKNVLLAYGIKDTYKCYKIPYRRYKHRPGKVKHNLKELLFFIKKGVI